LTTLLYGVGGLDDDARRNRNPTRSVPVGAPFQSVCLNEPLFRLRSRWSLLKVEVGDAFLTTTLDLLSPTRSRVTGMRSTVGVDEHIIRYSFVLDPWGPRDVLIPFSLPVGAVDLRETGKRIKRWVG
jgi:hypothetical protein